MAHIRQSRPDPGLGTYKIVKTRSWPWHISESQGQILALAYIRQSRPDSGLGTHKIVKARFWHIQASHDSQGQILTLAYVRRSRLDHDICKTVKVRLWHWLSGETPYGCSPPPPPPLPEDFCILHVGGHARPFVGVFKSQFSNIFQGNGALPGQKLTKAHRWLQART